MRFHEQVYAVALVTSFAQQDFASRNAAACLVLFTRTAYACTAYACYPVLHAPSGLEDMCFLTVSHVVMLILLDMIRVAFQTAIYPSRGTTVVLIGQMCDACMMTCILLQTLPDMSRAAFMTG